MKLRRSASRDAHRSSSHVQSLHPHPGAYTSHISIAEKGHAPYVPVDEPLELSVIGHKSEIDTTHVEVVDVVVLRRPVLASPPRRVHFPRHSLAQHRYILATRRAHLMNHNTARPNSTGSRNTTFKRPHRFDSSSAVHSSVPPHPGAYTSHILLHITRQISSAPETAHGDPFGNFCILTRLAGVGNIPRFFAGCFERLLFAGFLRAMGFFFGAIPSCSYQQIIMCAIGAEACLARLPARADALHSPDLAFATTRFCVAKCKHVRGTKRDAPAPPRPRERR